LVAQNSYGYAYSSILSFATSGGSYNYDTPYVQTNSATSVYTSSAVLNGSVNPRGSATTVWFEYGYTGQGFTLSSSSQYLSGGTYSQSVAINATNLSPNTTYNFRAVARNSYGTVYGETLTFTTTGSGYQSSAPQVTTGNYASVTQNSSILWATVNPSNSVTSLWFEYGTSAFNLANKSYGYTVPAYSGSGEYYNSISGLAPNTTYFYRAVGQNAYGTTRGEIKFFKTAGGYYPPVNPPVIVGTDEDIFLDPSVNDLAPKAGDIIDYVLTYRNASENRITSASVKVVLPEEAEYVDSSIRPDSEWSNGLTFYIGNLEKGNQGSITIKVKIKEDTIKVC
jgi:uncharacterized repeat protein (TIGR01451 family)